MTYGFMLTVTRGLLTGDNLLPEDNDTLLSLSNYALTTVATKAESLHLMTLSTDADILRLAHGDYLIRRPDAPEDYIDELDIDEELGFAVSRFLASYVSRDKGGIHVQAATRIITDFNGKVSGILEQMDLEASFEDLPTQGCTLTAQPSSEFSL